MICNNCGKEIPDNAGFCSYCGNKIEILEGEAPEERIPEIEAPVVNPHHKDNVSDLAGHINIKKPEINKEAIKDAYKSINLKKVGLIVSACVVVFIVIVAIAIPKNEVKEAKVSSTPSIHAESKVEASVSSVAPTVESKPEKEEVKPNITAQYEINKGISFNDGRAIVYFYDGVSRQDEKDDNKSVALIDTNGYIIWYVSPERQKELWGTNVTYRYKLGLDAMDGTYCIYAEATMNTPVNGVIIVDSHGNELFNSANSENDTTFDYMGCGGGVYFVRKHVKNFSTNKDFMVGINSMGEIVYEKEMIGDFNTVNYAKYYEGGLFLLYNNRKVGRTYYIMNMDNKKITEVEGSMWFDIIDIISEEEAVVHHGSSYYLISLLESNRKIDESKGLSSARISYGERMYSIVSGEYDSDLKTGVYDYKGNFLHSYPEEWNIKNSDRFSGGYSALEIEGADGKTYVSIVDTEGKPKYEPVKVNNVKFPAYHGYIYAKIEDNWVVITPDGYTGDIDNIRSSAENFNIGEHIVRNGYELLKGDKGYEGADGKLFKTIYKVTNYGEIADKNIDPSGSQITTPSSSVESKSSTAYTTQKNYKNIDNFNIKGKWKNVGAGTFGQAQSGAIISFDGKNCNFFSPNDTYAFYKDGSNYILDCTSPLSSTVTSTVKIVDENNIDIIRGSTIIELKRVV